MVKEDYKKNIWKLYLLVFFKEALLFNAVLIPFFTLWGKVSFSEVMVLQAIFTISVFLLEVPTGAVSDHFSRKTSLMLGSIVSVAGFLIYASHPSFFVFAIGEIVLAMGFSLFSGADHAILYDSLKKSKIENQSKKIFARFGTASLVGIMVGSMIGSVIANYLGLRMTMVLTSIPMVLAFFVAASLKEPPTRKRHEKKHYFKDIKKSIWSFKKHPVLRLITYDYILVVGLAFFIVWVYQVVLTEVGIDIAWFGFINATFLVCEIIILNKIGFLEKLFGGKKKYLFISAIIPGIGFILLGAFSSWTITIISICLIAGFGLTRRDVSLSYLNKYIDSKHRATVLSAISMLYTLTLTLSNLILGYFVDINLRYTLIGLGIMIMLVAITSKVKEEHLLD